MTTPIDLDRFLAEYARLRPDPYEGSLPDTVEDLFDELHDPDEFYDSLGATILATRAAVNLVPATLADDPLLDAVTVYPGDVRVEADFTYNSHVLVLGNLDVSGTITASPAHAILMVAGDVTCRAIQLVRGYLFVTGSVHASECFFGCAYGFSKVAGTIRTRLYLYDDSWANLRLDQVINEEGALANVEAGVAVCTDDDEAAATLAGILRPDVVGDELDPHDLLGRIARGDDVFKP